MAHDLTPGDGQDLLARFKAAREQRDPEAMTQLFAEQADLRVDPFLPPRIGALDIRAHWNRIAAEEQDVEFDAEGTWVAGRTVLSSWHVAWTAAAVGARIRERGFSTMELDAPGLIVRMRSWPVRQVVHGGAVATPGELGHASEEVQDGR